MLTSLYRNAYGIYLLHYGFVTWTQFALLTAPIPPAVKAATVLAVAVLIVVGVLAWASGWYGSSDTVLATRAVIVVLGFCIGFIMHRSRLCFARAFREPFMTAEGEPVLGDFDLSRDTASSIRFVRVCGCTVLCCGQLCVSSNVAFAEHLASPMHAGWT